MGDQVIAQRQRRAEHGEQPPAQAAIGEQSGAELVPSGVGVLVQPNQRTQRGVGVRRARQRPQQVDVGLVVVLVPTQLRQTLARGRIDQSEPADAGQLGALASRVWSRPRR